MAVFGKAGGLSVFRNKLILMLAMIAFVLLRCVSVKKRDAICLSHALHVFSPTQRLSELCCRINLKNQNSDFSQRRRDGFNSVCVVGKVHRYVTFQTKKGLACFSDLPPSPPSFSIATAAKGAAQATRSLGQLLSNHASYALTRK